MKVPTKALIREPKSPRGLVPNSTFGRFDEPYNAFLDELDPRGTSERARVTQQALALSQDNRFQHFLMRVLDPAYKKRSLAAIAKGLDISLPEFAEFWRKACHMQALVRAAEGSVAITKDMIEDARSKVEVCGRCDGYGFVFADEGMPKSRPMSKSDSRPIRTCPECSGSGSRLKPGDTDSRKLVLEMAGHTGKRSPAVQINQNFGGASFESAVDRLNRVTFDVDPGDVVEVPEESTQK